MAINYAVQAEVIDIRSDHPKAEDAFLVDTNVWYWMTYPTSAMTSAFPNQLSDYPNFVKKALAAGSKVCHSGLSFAELAHLIEKTEREIYNSYNSVVENIKTKEYRHNLAHEHSRVVSEVQAAWAQVKSMAEPLTVTIDDPTTDSCLARLQSEKVDGYDLFILESMKNHDILQVITDDGDFATVPGIQVFTANWNVIRAARNQGKLLTR